MTVAIALVLLGGFFVRHAASESATAWMYIYLPEDFHNLDDWATFILGLRIPIPPVISTLEIWSFLATGSTAIVTVYTYRMAIVGSYFLAVVLCYPSVPKALVSFLLSVPLLWGTVVVHRGNPQGYDVFFPFLVLAFTGLLRRLKQAREYPSRSLLVLASASGLVLGMAELTRPFVFFLMPMLLLGGVMIVRPLGKWPLAAFLIPIVFTSGLWHLHQARSHGQLLWTNHAGFNLIHAWPGTPRPRLVPERDTTPLAPGRWENSNNAEHLLNSRTLQHAVLRHLYEHPGTAAAEAFRKVFFFISAPTSVHAYTPFHRGLVIYRLVSFCLFLFLFTNVLHLGHLAVVAGRHALELAMQPENLLIGTAFLSLLMLSLGEREEEARLALSLLPMLAALPTAVGVRTLSAVKPA